MGSLQKWAPEQRGDHPSKPSDLTLAAWGVRKSASGVIVNEQTALTSSTVYGAVKLLAEATGMLPLKLYRRLSGGGKELADEHPLFRIIHTQPNSEMTSQTWRELIVTDLLLYGNHYSFIMRNNAGKVLFIRPLRPDKMAEIYRAKSGNLFYRYTPDRLPQVLFPATEIMHLRGLSKEGIMGYNPINLAREAIGLSLAVEEYGAKLFANDATPGGILRHPGALSPEAKKSLRADWVNQHQGSGNAHTMTVLEENMEYEKVGLNPEEAQAVPIRKFQLQEVARVFNVPPHMLKDLEKASFNNIEQQSLEFVTYSLGVWLKRIEGGINKDLIVESEQATLYAEHLVEGLLRGDIKTRYQAYNMAWRNSWMSADEIREKENMNPQPGGLGAKYYAPLNMAPTDQVDEGDGVDGFNSLDPHTRRQALARRAASARRRIEKSYRRVYKDVALRIIKRERADILRAAEKYLGERSIEQLNDYLDGFYKEHPKYVTKNMSPVMEALAESIRAESGIEIGEAIQKNEEFEIFLNSYLEAFLARWIDRSHGQLRAVIREANVAGEDIRAALETRFDQWEERRPVKVAKEETVRLSNAVAYFAFGAGGITRLQWNTFGDKNCPYCESLDGKIVGIEGAFHRKGDKPQPEGADAPLTVTSDVFHPPLHGG